MRLLRWGRMDGRVNSKPVGAITQLMIITDGNDLNITCYVCSL